MEDKVATKPEKKPRHLKVNRTNLTPLRSIRSVGAGSLRSVEMDLKEGFTRKTEAFEHKQDYPDALTLTSFGRGRLTSFGQDGPKWEGFTRKTELF
jgi:hypothetical protein